ncbi:MAG TPA: hypothetical protein VFZ63_13270 [Jiangellaceae bacterium]
MDDKRDANFEILDLGPAYDKGEEADDDPAQDGAAQPAVVIDLGDGTVASAPPRTLSRWQRWAVMTAVFAAGVAFGGYGWHARTEAIDAARVNLTGVDIGGQLFDDIEQSRLFARIHNAGDRDVTIADLRWPHTPEAPGDGQSQIAIQAGETTGAPIRGQIDCEYGRPGWLEADVATEAGITMVPVPVAPNTALDFLLSAICDGAYATHVDDPGIFFAGNLAPAASAPSHTVLGIDHLLGDTEIVDVTVGGAPGFNATPTNLPIKLRRGTGATLELDWAVMDCAATQHLGAVEAQFTFKDSDRSFASASLPRWTIAQLARLAEAECGS